jgi:hypothetical protein
MDSKQADATPAASFQESRSGDKESKAHNLTQSTYTPATSIRNGNWSKKNDYAAKKG